jgi:hypothetical protein
MAIREKLRIEFGPTISTECPSEVRRATATLCDQDDDLHLPARQS